MRAVHLRNAGASSRAITAAVASGVLRRPRRGWLAVASVDPYLLAAARAGVVLTCVTQARRLGLWVLAEERPHVGAPSHAGTVSVDREDCADGEIGELKATVHWAKPLVARDPKNLADPITNVLGLVAECRPLEEALIVWESALRKKLVEREVIAALPLKHRARAVLDAASAYSDSGLETLVVPRLRWIGERIVQQVWLLGHRVDFLIGARLVLQIDGGTHVGAQRDEDNRHDALLRLAGYHVIRVSYRQVIDDWPGVQAAIMEAIARGLHRTR